MESASCFVQGHLAVSTGRPSLVSGSTALRLAEACAVPKLSSYRNISKTSELKNNFLSGADGQEFFSPSSFTVDTTRKFVSSSKETMFTVSLTASAMPVGQQPASGAVALKKVGVLLLNLGGPEKVEDVKPFLYNLFADPDILRTPLPFLQKPLAAFISQVRSKQSEENYKSIGGGSPIRKITEDQAEGVEKFLKAKGFENLKVYVGMRYWHPFTEEAIQQIKKDGIETLVVLPLYPQFSVSTSGSSFRLLNQVIQEDPEFAKIDYTVIPSWYNRPGYVKCQADLIRTELEQFEDPSKAHIMFSAHGVPRSYVEQAGDPYQYEMERCVDAIMKTLNVSNEHTLCYQSRVGPVEWLRPYTEETIPELAQKGITDLLVVPISFVSEHIETLEEIDQEYRELAEESGIKRWRRVPALDTYEPFLQDLADMVEEALQSKKITVDDAFDAVAMRVVKKIPIGTRPMTAQEWGGWGFTKIAEAWNGRLAMIASLLVIYELITGHLAFK